MRVGLLFLCVCWSVLVCAQDENAMRQRYMQAEEEYKIGRLEEAARLLDSNMNHFTGTLKLSAYRLLSLCYLGKDDMQRAEEYVSLLLKEDPYYNVTLQDPLRFVDMVERFKKGQVTITTASQQEETVDEAPVPVTLITEEMLAAVGATTLKEALLAYVPGISSIESNYEDNIAMRGIYSSGQQKILIMLNGQQLNSYSTNIATPDYSMSLEKVKQIEVLRGPASSLYGSIALTAVINIITKDGRDIDGVSFKIGMGNNGQQKADFLYGRRYMDLEVLAWASFYKSDGQRVFIPAAEQYAFLPQDGEIVVGGYNRKPSYDFGSMLNLDNWELLFSRSHSKKVNPLGSTIFCAPYGYDNYNDYQGEGVGHAVTSTNARLTYKKKVDNSHLSLQTLFNQNESSNYDAIGNVPKGVFLIPVVNSSELYGGPFQNGFQYLHWNDYSLGLNFKIETNYHIGSKQKGILISGVEYEYFSLYDSHFLCGEKNKVLSHSYIEDGKETVPNLVRIGHEQTANAFLQVKHYFMSQLLLNAGLRFDYKIRNDNQNVIALSPRFSLIYLGDKLNFKLSYSRAFVDAPYFMRNTLLRTYKGGSDLQPEYLNSVQFTTQLNRLVPNFDFEANLFYNEAYDVVALTRSEPLGQQYMNSASMKMAGSEIVLKYQSKRWLLNLNTTFQQVISENNLMPAGNGYVNSVPKMMNNMVLNYKLWDTQRKGCFSLHTNLSYTSKQKTLLSVRPLQIEKKFYQELPGCFLMNLGANYSWKRLSLSGDIKNLFDKCYQQGGASVVPIQQLRRQVLFQVSYAF